MHSWDRGPTCMLEPRILVYKSNFFSSHIYIYRYILIYQKKKAKELFFIAAAWGNLYDNNKSRYFATNALFKWLCHLWITEYFHNYSIFGNHCLKAWIIDLLFSPEVRGQNSHMSSSSFQERKTVWRYFARADHYFLVVICSSRGGLKGKIRTSSDEIWLMQYISEAMFHIISFKFLLSWVRFHDVEYSVKRQVRVKSKILYINNKSHE